MHAAFSHRVQATSELAASLTDVGLEMLSGVDMPGESIETELRLWYTLQAELERASHGPQELLQVLHRATRRVASGNHSPVEARRRERTGASLCCA